MTPCPKGRYNNQMIQSNLQHCQFCEAGTYNNLEGQTGCKPCGSSASSSAGSTTCDCIGENRKFHQSTGFCLCARNYEPVDERSGDSPSDCKPVLKEVCPDGKVKNGLAQCVSPDDCSASCGDAGGKRTAGLSSMCLCNSYTDPDLVCDQECRDSISTVTITSTGTYQVVNSAGETVEVDVGSNLEIKGEPKCYAGMSCQARSVGKGAADYSVNPNIEYESRRLLGQFRGRRALSGTQEIRQFMNQIKMEERSYLRKKSRRGLDDDVVTATEIDNPVVCMSLGDTLIFDVDVEHYPVYLKDDIANTLADFDYSLFEDLGSRLEAGEIITTYAYTFIQSGVFVFGDSANLEMKTVVGIMADSESCPDTDKYIQPLTIAALLQLGLTQDEDLDYDPPWSLILNMLLMLIIVLPLLICFLSYFHDQSWRRKKLSTIMHKSKETEKEKTKGGLKGEEGKEEDDENLKHLVGGEGEGDGKININDPNAQETKDVDPKIFDEIYRDLIQHTEFVKDEFGKKAEVDEKNISEVYDEIDKLKKLIQMKLKTIARSFGKNIKTVFKRKKRTDPLDPKADQDDLHSQLSSELGSEISDADSFDEADKDDIRFAKKLSKNNS